MMSQVKSSLFKFAFKQSNLVINRLYTKSGFHLSVVGQHTNQDIRDYYK